MNENKILDINAIKEYIPHRYPFLMLDRVLDYNGEYVKALKNVSVNEEYFQGHFPNNAVMPGVLMIEALAQAACFLSYDEFKEKKGSRLEVFFMGIENARFRKVVTPGDQLILEIKLIKKKRDFWWVEGKVSVGDVVVCDGNFSAVLKVTSADPMV